MADSTFYIYSITNTTNKKRYIGSTVSTSGRWKKHKWELNKGIHSNEHLQRAWKKSGAKSFLFEVMHTDFGSAVFKKNTEDDYIIKYDTINPEHGYNINKANLIENKLGEETKKKISASLTNHPKNSKEIVQYEIVTGKHINTWPSSQEIKRELSGISQSGVIQCCRHNPSYKSVKGFGWAYKDEYFSKSETDWARPDYVPHFKRTNKKRAVVGKNVMTGEVLRFESIQDAAEHFGCANKYIQRGVQMSGTRGRKTCKGHIWEYAN